MRIRKAALDDLPAIERLISQTSEVQTPSGHDLGPAYNRELLKNGIGLVAEVTMQFAGFLLAEADKKTGFSYLPYLVIARKYRGLGLGSMLLRAYEVECKKRGIHLLIVDAPAFNKKALQFYRQRGFVQGKPRIPFYKKLRK